MLMNKHVGRNGASRKYDLLSALATSALARGKNDQRQALRLICLITARYNWQTDELSVGQAEIARLWSVDLRTVKREMAALRLRGWLAEKRGAGRGRVTVHGLGIGRILSDTEADWGRVGPDLAERLQGVAPATNVVAFPLGGVVQDPSDGSLWDRARHVLHAQNAMTFAAWLAPLQSDGLGEGPGEGHVQLRAPSAFHASYVSTHLAADMLAVLTRLDPTVTGVRVV